jgi:CRP-like cAMP-binding protein
VKGFGESSVDYTAYFWISDYGLEREARDQVRTNLWYTFRRRNIEIPYPIQIQYERVEEPLTTEKQIAAAAEHLSGVSLFAPLSSEARHGLATSARHHLFAAGEAIVRQGASGDSMFVILAGRVRVLLEPSGQEVAVTPAGGFFGEMSLLTGEPRTATVRAIEDVMALEITAAVFRELAIAHPSLLDHISMVVSARRIGLDEVKASAAAAATQEVKHTFLARMRKFLNV